VASAVDDRRCLTGRSTGAPTAGHQARAAGTRYIVCGPGLASTRCRPVNSALGSGMQRPGISALRPGSLDSQCKRAVPRHESKELALREATAETRSAEIAWRSAEAGTQGNEGASRRRAAPGSQPGYARRCTNCQCGCERCTKTELPSQPTAAQRAGFSASPAIRASNPSRHHRLPRGRCLTGRSTGAPTARHLAREAQPAYPPPRGQGATPSSPGQLCVRQRNANSEPSERFEYSASKSTAPRKHPAALGRMSEAQANGG
jgi:hypothetical protein